MSTRSGWALLGVAALLGTIGLGAESALATTPRADAGDARAPGDASPAGGSGARRLNEQQYIRSVHDIFGADIKIPGRFEPSVREEGLLAIGDSKVAVSASGFEQSELRAREIAAQVLSDPKRTAILACHPAAPKKFDAACADEFITKYGRLLYRRPLNEVEHTSTLNIARQTAKDSGDFYKGLQMALARLLVSPNFIFRIEQVQPDPQQPGQWRLTDYSLATRISFLLWDSPPDAELLDAVARGELRTQQGLEKQVDRLMASPKFEQGVRAFFSDMFGYEQFDALVKDQSILPLYSSQMAQDAREQALRTIVDLLITQKGDYRDLFTTRKTFMNRGLGGLYNVPVSAASVDGWAPYTFDEDQPRAGLLALAGFLMLDVSHEARTSPTIRGKTVRERFLCQSVPVPPANVNFALVQDVHNPMFKTARGRLTEHRQNPVCAGCHKITDPIGLSMENYDAIGSYRTRENDAPIDASGTFDGHSYNNLLELENILHDSPTVTNCATERAYEYGVGRHVAPNESDLLHRLTEGFARAGYAFPALMREVAVNTAFQTTSGPATVAGPALVSKGN